ncbi:hypothetical protein F6Y05_38200 [Bacillus megaterium]|nr:hypothetical protein [Priestia megaterium]
MFKKTLFLMFSFFMLFSTVGTSVLTVYAADTAITSSKYGSQMKKPLSFDKKTCSADYDRLNAKVSDIKEKDYKTKDDDDLSGIAGKMADMGNKLTIFMGNMISKAIFGSACYLGFAPSQLLQIMFFPVVLDNFLFLDTLSSVVRTISILVLGVVTILSIYELNKKEGTIGEEIISKIGKFLVAGGLIAFSGYILQGIFDIANALGYFVSHYQVDIKVDPDAAGGGKGAGTVSVNLLNFPTIFLIYLEFAFSPKILNEVPLFTTSLLGLMTIIKIIVLIFMVKDLLQIAVYGLKRLITLVASAILMPILAGLIPSYKTQDIFNKYFRSLIGSAFAPVLFGIIYLASAPFVIDDMVNMIDAPLLKLLTIGFYLNILVSIPGYVDSLISSSNALGVPSF